MKRSVEVEVESRRDGIGVEVGSRRVGSESHVSHGVAEALGAAADCGAEVVHKERDKEKGNSPHTPLKEKETEKETTGSVSGSRVRVRVGADTFFDPTLDPVSVAVAVFGGDCDDRRLWRWHLYHIGEDTFRQLARSPNGARTSLTACPTSRRHFSNANSPPPSKRNPPPQRKEVRDERGEVLGGIRRRKERCTQDGGKTFGERERPDGARAPLRHEGRSGTRPDQAKSVRAEHALARPSRRRRQPLRLRRLRPSGKAHVPRDGCRIPGKGNRTLPEIPERTAVQGGTLSTEEAPGTAGDTPRNKDTRNLLTV